MANNESKTVKEQKLAILKELEREDLIEIFKDWQPRQAKNKKKGAPLDQRISISVTDIEREMLDREIKKMSKVGGKVTMSQLVRNRALGSVDINEWREIAKTSLKELENTFKAKKTIETRIQEIKTTLKDPNNTNQKSTLSRELSELNDKIKFITSQNQNRRHRLSGRMSMIESETIKWRAQRLCLSSSDYLRMMIFSLTPNSSADAHLSFDGKRRFYVSIVDVAVNGWGEPPTIRQCTQCENYMDEIRILKDRINQLESFL